MRSQEILCSQVAKSQMIEAREGISEALAPTVSEIHPFDQRYETAEGRREWKSGNWELPEGAGLGAADGRGTIILGDSSPVPRRAQPRLIHFKETAGCRAAGCSFFLVSCVGEMEFPSRKLPYVQLAGQGRRLEDSRCRIRHAASRQPIPRAQCSN